MVHDIKTLNIELHTDKIEPRHNYRTNTDFSDSCGQKIEFMIYSGWIYFHKQPGMLINNNLAYYAVMLRSPSNHL